METITRNRMVHYYYQVKEILQKSIEEGEFKPGDRLPAEQILCEKFGVSRITVRKALELLVQEGFIYRERGRGTFVTVPPLKQPAQIISFTEELRRLGLEPGTKVLKAEIFSGKKKIAQYLSLNTEEEIVLIQRLRLANGEPIGIEISYLPHKLFPNILAEDLSSSLLEITREKYSLSLRRATQKVKAISVSRKEASLLGIKPGSPVLYFERISFLADNRPAEYLEAIYRSDRYELVMELRDK